MKKIVPLTAAVAAILIVLVLSGCSRNKTVGSVAEGCVPAHQFSTVRGDTLSVGLVEIPPFSYTDDGNPRGIDVDIVGEFAERECLTVTYQPLTYSAAVPSVAHNRIDLTVGDWYRTAARTKVVNMSDPIYLDQFSVISTDGADTVRQLETGRVGTVDGYLWVEDLRALLGDRLQVYPSSAELKKDIEAGRVKYGVDALGTAEFNFDGTEFIVKSVIPDDRVAATIQPPQVGFPYPLDNQALGTALNAAIADLHASGRMAAILTEHGLSPDAAEVGPPRLVQ